MYYTQSSAPAPQNPYIPSPYAPQPPRSPKKKWTAGKIIALLLTIFITIGIILTIITVVIGNYMKSKEIVLNLPIQNVSPFAIFETQDNIWEDKPLVYYENETLSLHGYYSKHESESPMEPQKIYEFNNGQYMYSLFIEDSYLGVDNAILGILYRLNSEGEISEPITINSATGLHGSLTETSYNYTKGDLVAKDIVNSFYRANSTTLASNGTPIYYGFCLTEEVYDLTILGYSPTEIVPIAFEGEQIYMWYYTEHTEEFSDAVAEFLSPVLREDATYGDILERLKVQFKDIQT